MPEHPPVMRAVFAVQRFEDDEKWRSLYIASFLSDAVETYDLLRAMTETNPIRLVRFMVPDGFDFLGTYCRDFAVMRRDRH